MTKKIGKDIVQLNNETIWRIPTDSDLQWRLTYAPDTITNTDKLVLASLIDSYQYLVFEITQKQRNAVCEEIKEIIVLDNLDKDIEAGVEPPVVPKDLFDRIEEILEQGNRNKEKGE